MARRLQDKTNVTAPGGNYPYGRVKNNSGANDGTPVDENLVGDEMQFWERLLAIGGVVANGLPENTANTFQYMIALINIIVAQATTLVNAEAAIRSAADSSLSNSKLSKSGGGGGNQMTGYLDMGGQQIANLPAVPFDAASATSGAYVDGLVSSEATARANADTALQNGKLTYSTSGVSDFNSMSTQGQFPIYRPSAITNEPAGLAAFDHLILDVSVPSNGEIIQRLTGVSTGGVAKMYMRYFSGGSWNAWVTFAV